MFHAYIVGFGFGDDLLKFAGVVQLLLLQGLLQLFYCYEPARHMG